MATHKLHLISFDLCPFVERSRIVLEEKGLPYELTLIDLQCKPEWFLAISPRGKVPVLLVDDRPVFESMVINELLEELYPEKRMFPRDPFERAVARAWIVFCNDVINPASFALAFTAKTEQERDAARAALTDAFGKVEQQLATRSEGEFFLGGAFGLVDAAYAPFFDRWLALTPQDDPLVRYPALSAYARALDAYPAVKAAQPANLAERYRDLLRERGARV